MPSSVWKATQGIRVYVKRLSNHRKIIFRHEFREHETPVRSVMRKKISKLHFNITPKDYFLQFCSTYLCFWPFFRPFSFLWPFSFPILIFVSKYPGLKMITNADEDIYFNHRRPNCFSSSVTEPKRYPFHLRSSGCHHAYSLANEPQSPDLICECDHSLSLGLPNDMEWLLKWRASSVSRFWII